MGYSYRDWLADQAAMLGPDAARRIQLEGIRFGHRVQRPKPVVIRFPGTEDRPEAGKGEGEYRQLRLW